MQRFSPLVGERGWIYAKPKHPNLVPIGARFGFLVIYELCGSVATCRIMSVSSSTDSSQPLTSHA